MIALGARICNGMNTAQVSKSGIRETAKSFAGALSSWKDFYAFNHRLIYHESGSRDLRLDLLRGAAAFGMVVDHMGGASYLYAFTGGNAYFISAAEVFVFVSGMVVGLVYGGLARKEGLYNGQIKAFDRAWTLYKLTIALTLIFAALSYSLNLPWAETLKTQSVVDFVFDVFLLRASFYLTDIPMLYTFLMVLSPIGLWLLYTHRTKWMLLGSSAIWLAFQLDPHDIVMPWTIDYNPTFNLAAWQLLFFWAMAIGYHRERLTRWVNRIPLPVYVIGVTVFLILLLRINPVHMQTLEQLFPNLNISDAVNELSSKSSVGVIRIFAAFTLFQVGFFIVTVFWRPIHWALGWLLLPLGQYALYAYVMHVIMVGLLFNVTNTLHLDEMMNGIVNTGLQVITVLVIREMIKRRFLFSVVPH